MCKKHGEMRSACKIIIGNSEGKRLLGKPRFNFRIVLKLILKMRYVEE
jgi:hypothetical protein